MPHRLLPDRGVQSIAVLLVMGAILAGCTPTPAPDASGEEIYLQLCGRCHGEDLAGGIGPALGPGSNSASQDDEFLELTITRGRGRMPAFGSNLATDQMERLIGFLRERQG
ncbi:MAG TPA: cytochrome c [Acidimicrobiia bacterium]|nr:cytochrome c [Acidimicrobiia bacterium]